MHAEACSACERPEAAGERINGALGPIAIPGTEGDVLDTHSKGATRAQNDLAHEASGGDSVRLRIVDTDIDVDPLVSSPTYRAGASSHVHPACSPPQKTRRRPRCDLVRTFATRTTTETMGRVHRPRSRSVCPPRSARSQGPDAPGMLSVRTSHDATFAWSPRGLPLRRPPPSLLTWTRITGHQGAAGGPRSKAWSPQGLTGGGLRESLD